VTGGPVEGDVIEGDCLELLATWPESSIDAIVTDPPYGLEFMGREWDAFRIDPRSARWASQSGNAGSFGDSHVGRLPSYTKRRTTSRCTVCSKRDAFRNPHACGGDEVWLTEYVDAVPVELRAYQNWCEQWAREVYRVAKPGAHLLAFGGTRTYHRLACALEDAGWEIRDCLVWGYASGFPKSLDVSKALDKAAGATREVVGSKLGRPGSGFDDAYGGAASGPLSAEITAPATLEAALWKGWGTALKPAWEPIVMARKPLRGTVISNVLAHGTGALNIDAGRIPFASAEDQPEPVYGGRKGPEHDGKYGNSDDYVSNVSELGRWPANVALTDPIFDGDAPGVVGGGDAGDRGGGWYEQPAQGEFAGASFGEHLNAAGKVPFHYGDGGTYSRFFLIPKADRGDREPILPGGLEPRLFGMSSSAQAAIARGEEHIDATIGLNRVGLRLNTHPTVKPIELMRHLVRLVTPPRGLVLDPFLGSGTTAIACENEGFRWVGIERDAEYVAIARARLVGVQRGLGLAG
jgi:site-specific DNA-methyltransferase (adenine-specific)